MVLIELHQFSDNRDICVVYAFHVYLEKTKCLRYKTENLFITLLVLHRSASVKTISRWLKWTLARAGININKYSGHSTRSAVTSAARDCGVNINSIKRSAGWTNASTFCKFYKKLETTSLGQAVLDRYLSSKK